MAPPQLAATTSLRHSPDAWKAVVTRHEHLYVLPTGSYAKSIFAQLQEQGYWCHKVVYNVQRTMRIYQKQRAKWELDRHPQDQPRLLMTDADWHFMQTSFGRDKLQHLVAHLSFPDIDLSIFLRANGFEFDDEVATKVLQWLYYAAIDGRYRLMPDLAYQLLWRACVGESTYKAYSQAGAAYMREWHPELINPLVWIVGVRDKFSAVLRKDVFRQRARSYISDFALPYGLRSTDLGVFCENLGIVRNYKKTHLTFQPAIAAGILLLKKTLTHDAIRASVGG